jgi:2-oxoglutarate dehydrogenase complex dehydrogenase (E1) component-like enzyme
VLYLIRSTVSSITRTCDGDKVKISLLPNPSHLEAVNPVALGKTRAKQFALIREAEEGCMLGDKVRVSSWKALV